MNSSFRKTRITNNCLDAQQVSIGLLIKQVNLVKQETRSSAEAFLRLPIQHFYFSTCIAIPIFHSYDCFHCSLSRILTITNQWTFLKGQINYERSVKSSIVKYVDERNQSTQSVLVSHNLILDQTIFVLTVWHISRHK